MPAPLENFLRAYTSGMTALTPEMYDHFGGDDILEQIRKFDPNAKWKDDVLTSGGEAGSGGIAAKRLDFDISKLPGSQRGSAGLYDLAPSNLHANLKNPNLAAYDDPVYGSVRNSREFAPDKMTLLEIIGPLLVSLAAPMAGSALAGMGIGAAGGTAGVTGGLAGLGAGNIASGGVPTWLTKLAYKAPGIARGQANGFNPGALISTGIGLGAGELGINPNITSGAMTLGQLARGRR